MAKAFLKIEDVVYYRTTHTLLSKTLNRKNRVRRVATEFTGRVMGRSENTAVTLRGWTGKGGSVAKWRLSDDKDGGMKEQVLIAIREATLQQRDAGRKE